MFWIYKNVSVMSAWPCMNIPILDLNLESEKWCRGITKRLWPHGTRGLPGGGVSDSQDLKLSDRARIIMVITLIIF